MLIWVLGTTNESKPSPEEEEVKPGLIDFDREYFNSVGNFSEYLEEIQQVERETQKEKEKGLQLVPNVITSREEEGNSNTESPQWGFYVSITPPHQPEAEYFAKSSKKAVDLVKVNEEYRQNHSKFPS